MKGLKDAVVFAALKHSGQERKDGSPYIFHPMKVAQRLKEDGYGEEYQTAAMLHDVLEDTDAKEEELEEYGERVSNAVKLLTRKRGMKEDEYLKAIMKDPIARAVKEADKTDNMEELLSMDTSDPVLKSFAEYYTKKTGQYYTKVFSPALDRLIEAAEDKFLRKEEKEQESGMKPKLRYFYVGGSLDVFFRILDRGTGEEPDKTWVMTPDGWKRIEIEAYKWIEDAEELTKKQFAQEMKSLGWEKEKLDNGERA